MDTVHLSDKGNTRMIAHRGVSGLEMENTCAAFVAAGNRSYFGIETDVHRTLDGQFIIIHDDNTGRVADADLPVEGTDFAALRALRLHDRDEYPSRGDLVPPTLNEYIRVCKRYEKTAVLELKNHMEPEDIRRVVDVLQAEGYLPQTIFISFDLPNLVALRVILPDQKAQYLIEDRIPDDLFDTLRAHDLDLDIDWRLLTEPMMQRLHREGREVNVWTVNDPAVAHRLISWRVDFITSNILE